MIDVKYLGQRLIERGFRIWFKYMFRLVENRPFIEEKLHEGLFEYYEKISSLECLRLIFNLPPRSSKTTLAVYFMAYHLTINPRCNFIYTSYSQELLSQISSMLSNILDNPAYKEMYKNSFNEETVDEDPINDFWKDYLFKSTGKNKYTARKIITAYGGVVLFSSIGSAITGFGAGIRGAKEFSGCIFIDDPNKPSDVRSEKIREKVKIYFQETLLSRVNDSNVPIINIQQRLHLEDLSGILEKLYDFKVLKKRLIDDEGKCTLPSQYTEQRLEEIKKDDYVFSSQYQQSPVKLGGNVIKTAWFNYYPLSFLKETKFNKLFMTGDTAMKTKEHNDYSVFCLWGVYDINLYLIDLIRDKWEAPDLEKNFLIFWNKWKKGIKSVPVRSVFVEDKASGTGLIQTIKKNYVIPIIGIEVDKDKLTRVENVLSYIEAGYVYLPVGEIYGFNNDFLAETSAFSRDDSHKHDDQVDNLVYGIEKGIAKRKLSILDNV